MDIDFYLIEIDKRGEKYINPQGYYYRTDSEEKPYRFATYHYLMKLDDFLALSDKEKMEWLETSVRYIDDLTENDFMAALEEDMKNSNKLAYADLTIDTPVGYYHT